jgi:hypothetical protein
MLKDDDYYREVEICKEIESNHLENEKILFQKLAIDGRHFKENCVVLEDILTRIQNI